MSKTIGLVVLTAWIVYRLSITLRSVQARRAGATDRADLLLQRGVKASLVTGFLGVIVFFVALAIILR